MGEDSRHVTDHHLAQHCHSVDLACSGRPLVRAAKFGYTFAMGRIDENLERVREKISEAALNSKRSIDEVELIAISKTHPAESVREAFQAGQNVFGESR